jgi:hypothetical protein
MILKKPALFIALFCLLQAAHAQIDKGTIMAGGSLGFSYATDHQDEANTFTLNLTPLIGGFVARNFVLGAAPVVSYTSTYGTYVNGTSVIHIHTGATSLGLGPFARYYIKIGPKIYLFIHASPSIMASWSNPGGSSPPVIDRTISANWVIGPGLSVMLSKTVAIEVSLYYNGTWHRSANFVNGNLLGESGAAYIDNGMFFNAGFQVYFERNKKEKAVHTSN